MAQVLEQLVAPCILANDDLLKNMTPESATAELKKPRARAT
jgi:NADH:ubiquinone oxidoreductase subunit E